MRGNALEQRGWELDDIGRLRSYFPNRYRATTARHTRLLRPLERVKLSLLVLCHSAQGDEFVDSARVLVEVLTASNRGYTGRLLVTPALGTTLRRGDTIRFSNDHIVDSWHATDDDAVSAWLCFHPTNRQLRRALRRIAFGSTAPSGAEIDSVTRDLLDATFMVPLVRYPEGDTLAFSRTTDGVPFLPAYLDPQDLRNAYGGCPIISLSGRELVRLAVRERATAIAIDPVGQDDHLFWMAESTIGDLFGDL